MLLLRMGEAEAQSSNNALEIKKIKACYLITQNVRDLGCAGERDLYWNQADRAEIPLLGCCNFGFIVYIWKDTTGWHWLLYV